MNEPDTKNSTGRIAIVGGGPAGLVAAIALAREGIETTVLERDAHPELAPASTLIARTPSTSPVTASGRSVTSRRRRTSTSA